MQTFLERVARDLYNKLGTEELTHTVVVFPNKRARLFFNGHLAAQSTQPMWSPAYVSISELFRELSPYHMGDPIGLVCELYRIFGEETGSSETLDDFYFWGELLISDFDDADKNLVDTGRLFANLHDLHTLMDDYDFLDEEQEEAIRQFFQNFSIEHRTQLKERFTSLWDKLGSIYRRYRESLAEKGIAYEGMMYRQVIEQLDVHRLPYRHYVFVGFNVLNRVETQFFQLLADAGRAMFYWDYDRYYTTLPLQSHPAYTHEAGEFILRNLRRFPNELPEDLFDNMRQPKRIRFIASPTENAQARFIREELQTTGYAENPAETAVVLCNETLLLPVLHSLPPVIEHVNITMGFPLTQTPAFSFVNALVELQTEGYLPAKGRFRYEAVQSILKHPYTRTLSPEANEAEKELAKNNRFYPLPSELQKDAFLTLLFTPQRTLTDLCGYLSELLRQTTVLYRTDDDESDDIFNQLYRESLFKCHTLIGRLHTLLESGELNVQPATFRRLLNRLLTTAGIPFHGEPAIGMQVMGVLETRNLDFRNLLMLSVNEGQLPKAGGDSSFIPYNLRKAFGMTTIEHKNAVYAYYFYRLIQRAENITLLYNTSSDGLNRGEMSRFMLQLLVESPHTIVQQHLEAAGSPQTSPTISIAKTSEMTAKLFHKYDLTRHPRALLSPSALNTYLDCRLRFYYRYVAELTAPQEASAEIDSALFGTIFHRAAQYTYEYLTAHGKEIRKDDLEKLLKDDTRLQQFVDRAFKHDFFHIQPDEYSEYNGTQLINAKVIQSYLRQLLQNDLLYAPFHMEGMEQKVTEAMEIDTPHGKLTLNIGGTIDRMDSKEETLRIVDYKTGGSPKTPESVEKLFEPGENRPGYIFQTFLYAAIMCRKQPLKVAPSLLYIHRAASETYTPVIEMGAPRQPKTPVNNFAFYEDEFRERLQMLLHQLFDTNEAFTQTDDTKKCEYCDFRRLCRR